MQFPNSLLLAAAFLAVSGCASPGGHLGQTSGVPVVQEVAEGDTTDDPIALPPQATVELEPAMAAVPEESIGASAAAGTPVAHSLMIDVAPAGQPPDSSHGGGLPEVEQDAHALYTDAVLRDPWEKYNRRIHRFNNLFDRYILRPLAKGYANAVPAPVRSGVSRFFSNLGTPATALNQLLQGHPVHALQSLGRFAVNTTVGIVGVLDPATRMRIPKRDEEDFGQTLATWGWRDSRYLVMPLLGPRTVRDAAAVAADRRLSPLAYVEDGQAAGALQLLEIVDMRAWLLPMDEARRTAYDEYALVRDAWAQRRKQRIEQDLRRNGD